MKTPTVKLVRTDSESLGHCGVRKVESYEIFLNEVRLRGFSSHGNMWEGHWGSDAKPKAEDYAKAVADTLGVQVVRVRNKRRK